MTITDKVQTEIFREAFIKKLELKRDRIKREVQILRKRLKNYEIMKGKEVKIKHIKSDIFGLAMKESVICGKIKKEKDRAEAV